MSVPLDLVVCDVETLAIGPRPGRYPPQPVGVAIRWPNGAREYLAWGHPEVCLDGTPGGNNCTQEEATRAIRRAFQGPVLFHNGAFDCEVIWHHLGIEWPACWHDTLFLLFLANPHAPSYALKPSAMRLLGEPPEEQDAVRDWILAHVKGATRKNFGAHIALAPVRLVGPYAIGDVDRTRRLFDLLAPKVLTDMRTAYHRELRLCPHLVAAARRGIRVDRDLLREWALELDDTAGSGGAVDRCDGLIRARLNAPGLQVDSDEELALALDREGVMRSWELTDGSVEGVATIVDRPEASLVFGAQPETEDVQPRGRVAQRSVAKGALRRCCSDTELVGTLEYRNTAATMLRTFIRPWLEMSATDGRLHTTWHQVRGQDKNGTRTGRIASADPNLANVPNPKDVKPPAPGLPFLPSLRIALLPEPGEVWVSIDYSQQELRLAAHYEDGSMQAAYQRTPTMDLHDLAQKLIRDLTGKSIERKYIKNTAFAAIYGSGVPGLASMMEVSIEEAAEVRAAYFQALPGLLKLIERVKSTARTQKYVRSLGGRIIPLEEPREVKGRMRSWEYKMLNHLVQGSAADQTKEAIAQFCESGYSRHFMGQVYDEINASCPPAAVPALVRDLTGCMVGALDLDVPMLCDVEVGPSWGQLEVWTGAVEAHHAQAAA